MIDLIGYRRHGHSEVDDPTITQPLLYRAIKDHPPLWEIYAEDTGAEDVKARVEAIRANLEAAQKKARPSARNPCSAICPSIGTTTMAAATSRNMKLKPASPPRRLQRNYWQAHHLPEGFHIHPKVKKLLEQRAEMGAGKRPVDYGMAEALAFGSLAKAGVPVRLQRTGHAVAAPSTSAIRCCSI